MEIKIKRLNQEIELPAYAKEGDAAFDLRSAEETVLKIGETKAIATALAFEIPIGYAGLIWDRSGLAAKNALHTLAGVIDAGYRGEVKVVLRNAGKEDFKVEKGMRIAQMIIQAVVKAKIVETKELNESVRGEGGFGSSGLK